MYIEFLWTRLILLHDVFLHFFMCFLLFIAPKGGGANPIYLTQPKFIMKTHVKMHIKHVML